MTVTTANTYFKMRFSKFLLQFISFSYRIGTSDILAKTKNKKKEQQKNQAQGSCRLPPCVRNYSICVH